MDRSQRDIDAKPKGDVALAGLGRSHAVHAVIGGAISGPAALVRGAGFVFRTSSVWGLAVVPAVVATLFTFALFVPGFFGAEALAKWLRADETGMWRTIFAQIAFVLTAVAAFFLSIVLSIPLARIFSGWALERIAKRQTEALGIAVPAEGVSFLGTIKTTLTGLVLSVPFLLVLTVIELVFPPAAVVTIPLKFVVAALALSYDLLDYPMSIRGMGSRDRIRWMKQHWRAVFGFGFTSLIVLFVPMIGLFFLPIGAAGAARLMCDTDVRERERSG